MTPQDAPAGPRSGRTVTAVVSGYPAGLNVASTASIAEIQAAAVLAADYGHLLGPWEVRHADGRLLDPAAALDSVVEYDDLVGYRVFVNLRPGEGA